MKIPFELSNNFILLQVQVNDSRPLWFIFDTGASSSIINARLVKELKLQTKGKIGGSATGKAIEAELISGVTLSVPGVKVFNQPMASLPMDDLSPLVGKSISGVIGYDFIREFVVEVDYAAKIMNLYSPTSFKRSVSGELLPIKFINKKPALTAKIKLQGREAIEDTFLIDTGADGVMTVKSSFVQAHQLLRSLTRGRRSNLGGAGGASESFTARVENIQLGRFVLNKPLVDFSLATKETEVRSNFAGALGGEVFRRFTLILDYSRRRIILEPNAHLLEPVEADMSGIELAADGEDFKTFVVNEVAADSPAAEAGLKEEDELTTVDGRPVSEFGLDQIRQMFKQEGKEYLLDIVRGDEKKQLKLKLRRLI